MPVSMVYICGVAVGSLLSVGGSCVGCVLMRSNVKHIEIPCNEVCYVNIDG